MTNRRATQASLEALTSSEYTRMAAVQKITILTSGGDGQLVVKEVRSKKKSKKQGTFGIRLVERMVHTMADANATAAKAYVDRHDKSAGDRRDGWLYDAPVNVVKAGMDGVKRIKISNLW